jgi:hypothetical protein
VFETKIEADEYAREMSPRRARHAEVLADPIAKK